MPLKRAEPVEQPTEVECAAPDCEVRFAPKRSTARYHSATCRQRAGRSRKAAAAEEKADTATAEHSLVVALRKELTRARKLDTFDGQVALELARRAVAVDSNLTAFDKLEAARRRALGDDVGAASAPEPAAEADDVTKAREARDRKRAAASQA